MAVAQKSLLLVTVDCLRGDHCGFNGYPRPTTPFLDSLAAESFVIPAAIVAGAPTYFSFPAILASRMPLALGRDVVGLAPGETTLATTLQQCGYATAAFSAANPYISPRFGYQNGFEMFKDFLDIDVSVARSPDGTSSAEPFGARSRLNHALKRTAHTLGLSRIYNDLYFQYCLRLAVPAVGSMDSLRKFPSAQVIVDRAISWLKTVRDRPFFLWLHLMDPHSPYYPLAPAFEDLVGRRPSATRARYVNEYWNRSDLSAARLRKERTSIVDLYDAGIRSADSQVARLVAHLKETFLWDHCVFALTADHGEEFLDHGGRYHAPVNLHEEIVRVPLIIREPASAKRQTPNCPFSHLNLAPTLLEALDVPQPKTFRGKSLWRNLREGKPWDDLAITECALGCTNPFQVEKRLAPRLLSIRNARYKLVMRLEWGATEELYDLDVDPGETRPLPASDPGDIRKEFLQAARCHVLEASDNRDFELRLDARLKDLRSALQSSSR